MLFIGTRCYIDVAAKYQKLAQSRAGGASFPYNFQ
jgi:hypothetical protein